MSEFFGQVNGTIVSIDELYRAGNPPKPYVRLAIQVNPADRLGPRPSFLVHVQAAGDLAIDVDAKLGVDDRVMVFGRWGVRGPWEGLFATSVGLDLRSIAVEGAGDGDSADTGVLIPFRASAD